jgi:UDP-GlcNAc:undecaprenyl-phosphate/decaprenyl-phosphate GlcNAc-1-phosphate transferase
MVFPFNVYAAAFFSAALISAASFPIWKRWCERTGHVDDPGHRKIHSKPTPLAGGLTVMTGFFVPLLLGACAITFWRSNLLDHTVRELLQYGLSRRAFQVGAILAGAFGMVLLGWADDRYELKPLPKLTVQFLCALAVAATGIRITLFIPSEPVNYALTILWILAITNALNFLDNMNGLCSGLGIIAAWCCAWSAAIQGQYLVALLGFLICGALLGFFPFNFPNAKAFLGDAGSHLVGFLIAILAILPNFYSRETAHALAVVSPILILAVPIFDLCSVIVLRLRAGKPVYVGDTNHVSHRLVRKGFSRSHAVLILLLINAAFATLAVLGFIRN